MALWARRNYPQPWRATVCALAANLVVHTLFWYTQRYLVTPWPVGLYRAELLVVLIEGALYARFLSLSGLTPWLLSLLSNVASLFFGFWLWQLLL